MNKENQILFKENMKQIYKKTEIFNNCPKPRNSTMTHLTIPITVFLYKL